MNLESGGGATDQRPGVSKATGQVPNSACFEWNCYNEPVFPKGTLTTGVMSWGAKDKIVTMGVMSWGAKDKIVPTESSFLFLVNIIYILSGVGEGVKGLALSRPVCWRAC